MADELDNEEEESFDLPPQVEKLYAAFHRLIAIQEITAGLKNLAEYQPQVYSFPGEFGDLPHALLRRTSGGLPDEMWANIEFELTRDEAGWLTLEFLAWFVRDHSRSGDQIQLRPMALPPKAYEIQLGRTLKFIIDLFVVCPGDGIEPMLDELESLAKSLSGNIDDYADILGSLIRRADN
jgi:hypothetical protein